MVGRLVIALLLAASAVGCGKAENDTGREPSRSDSSRVMTTKDNSITIRDKDGKTIYYEGHFRSDDPPYKQPLDPAGP